VRGRAARARFPTTLIGSQPSGAEALSVGTRRADARAAMGPALRGTLT